MIDIRRGIECLVPNAAWDYSVNNDGGSETDYAAIVWNDERTKPSWNEIKKAVEAAQRTEAQLLAESASTTAAAIAHAKSLGFTDAMISAMYPGLTAP
jgi:hypothetical protein